jgi:glycosyltransferase involved in cell wall biosynthesis
MKIAVLAHSFPRFRGDTHGTFVKSLCESLASLGHEIFMLIPFDPELREDPQTPLNIRSFRYIKPDHWHQLGYSRTLKRDVAMRIGAWVQSPLYFLFAQRALLRLVREENIDYIHAHWHLPNGWIAWQVHRKTGVPFGVTLHGSDVFMAERNALFSAMARGALHGAAHVTSCSADLQNRLLKLGGGPDEKVILVANGTELDPDAATTANGGLLARLAIKKGDVVVAAVGRMVDKKGFRYLLEAIPRILETYPETRFVLGGGGDLLPALEAQAKRLGLGHRLLFPGVLAHPQVLELVARADIFTMPSVRDASGNVDGLPIVVLEAMAAGTPVVASDLAGMPLAVDHGKTGLLVPEKDSTALASALNRLLADPEEARKMGDASRAKVVDELNWDAVARRHDALYRRAVEQA